MVTVPYQVSVRSKREKSNPVSHETSQPSAPANARIHKLKINDTYKDEALAQVKRAVDGNNYDPAMVKLLRFEGEVLQFEAITRTDILLKISRKTIPGRNESATKVNNEAAAREAIDKEYAKLFMDTDFERKVRDMMINRDDKGFSQDGVFMPIPSWHKEFVVLEPCTTCKTTGNVMCQKCVGKGFEPCVTCHSSGRRPCPQCRGQQQIAGSQGQKILCPTCSGRGRISCDPCRQTGRIKCITCRSRGTTQCPVCQGLAWTSQMYIADIEAKMNFEYPKDELPDKIVALLEKDGIKIRDHADIHILDAVQIPLNQQKTAEETPENKQEQKNNVLRLPLFYTVFLPYGHAEFEIAGKSYYTFIFGKNGLLTHVSPFLDDLLKDGMRKLRDAAEGRGQILSNLKNACTYRTIREALSLSLRYSDNRAMKKLKNASAFGLSSKSIKEIILTISKSLEKLTRTVRITGLIVSVLSISILYGLYFGTHIRTLFIQHLSQKTMHALPDMATLGLGIFIGMMLIQAIIAAKIKGDLRQISEELGTQAGQVRLGNIAFWNAGLLCLLYIGIIEICRSYGLETPYWYAKLRP